MKTILLPVDFSDHSVSTYKYAIKIAGEHEKTVLFFHHSYNDQITAPDPGIGSGFDNESFLNMQLIEEFRTQSIRSMNKLISEVKEYIQNNQLTNFEIKHSIEGGNPDWEIMNICSEIMPDFVIMGTQGAGKKEIFEGSVAKRIMNKAKVPVIAVPIGSHIDLNFINIMYACNSHVNDYKKIQLLFKLFQHIPIKIWAVHFQLEGDKKEFSYVLDELKDSFDSELIGSKLDFCLVNTKNKEDALDFFVKENDINSIAFISHKKNIFKNLFTESITKNDFLRLKLPLVALHE